jgi:hypothetical protein
MAIGPQPQNNNIFLYYGGEINLDFEDDFDIDQGEVENSSDEEFSNFVLGEEYKVREFVLGKLNS